VGSLQLAATLRDSLPLLRDPSGYLVTIRCLDDEEYDEGNDEERENCVREISHTEWPDRVGVDVRPGREGVGEDWEDEVSYKGFHDVSKVEPEDERDREAEHLVLG